MCGITAFFAPDGAITGPEVDAATAVLKHRGPDDRGVWISPDRHVGLGHARLSIIDLVGGHQPLANEDETIHLVANGEFYDFERIRQELERRGHHFRTKSDSEIALHLYEEHGVHGLAQLRGEFAFVIWDARNQTLVAARDRFGIKPLFYAEHTGRLLIASEAKALFAAGVPARWDSAMLHQWSTGALLPDRSLFAGVHQVPPGHYLLATSGSLRLHRYWDFNYPATGEPGPRQDLNAWAEEFRAAFDEAVRLRLRADVPVGCYLSGGIDSAAVLGFAARHSRQPIRAFTLSFDLAAYDERQLAQEMAALAGAEFVPIPIRQSDLATHFHDAIWNAETLFINGHGVAKYLLSRAVRDAGYKVVLTGEGSDEIFGGYAHFRRDILLYDADGQDPGEVRRLLKELEDSNPVSRGLLLPSGDNLGLDATRSTLGYVPSWFETFASAAAKRQSLFSAPFRSHFGRRDAWRAFLDGLDVPGQLTGRAPLHQSLYLWAKSLLPNYILTVLGDRMEMAHSVEGRVPFLDHHLVELVTRMPPAVKIRGLTEKLVLREAARANITDAIWRRQKHPFLAPPMTLKQDEPLNALMQDTLRGEALRSLPGYDRSQVIGLLDRLPQLDAGERTAWDPVLMSILSACALQERFHLTA